MEKKNIGFNIVNQSKKHQTSEYGLGSLSLENMSPIIIDVDAGEAVVDVGALHARSAAEKGIKFTTSKEEVPNGKLFWLIWVTVDENEAGPYYAGVTACEMRIDRENRKGYKLLAEHVNRMDKSLKRKIIVDHVDARSKGVLQAFLKAHDPSMWENSVDQLKNDLGS